MLNNTENNLLSFVIKITKIRHVFYYEIGFAYVLPAIHCDYQLALVG